MARVVDSGVVRSEEGDEITFMELSGFQQDRYQETHYIAYSLDVEPLAKGAFADCYLLPVDSLQTRRDGQSKRAVVAVIMMAKSVQRPTR